MKIMVLNGPNINMVGIREKTIYGSVNYEAMLKHIQDAGDQRNVELMFYQSNHEGDLVDKIQQAYFENYDGIVINPAAYTHTSVAIADAIKAIAPIPVVEIHISNISEREEFRQLSYCAPYCIAQVKGEGIEGYVHAMDIVIQHHGG